MAQRRMFSKQIIESDAFLDMPKSAQILYIHLCMAADDDGVINNVKRVMRVAGCRNRDVEVLKSAKFCLTLAKGLLVIKHWKMNNVIRSDRYKATEYQEEFGRIKLKPNNSYTICQPERIPNDIPTDIPKVVERLPQYSIGKYSIGKYSIDKDIGQRSLTEQSLVEKDADAKTDKKTKESKAKTKPISEYENSTKLFEIFWSNYPKKVGKQKCLKWFKTRKLKRELINHMVSTINIYKGSEEWKDPQFIPHPYTWLNRGGWDDELEVHNEKEDIQLTPEEEKEQTSKDQEELDKLNDMDFSDILGD